MKKIYSALVLLLGIVVVLDLFHPGFPVTHDGQDHIARIANFYQNLSEGNVIPRWAANLNWGYGHPILEFLYPLSSYTASFFHSVGFSFVDSVKIVLGLGIVLSGIFMYLWLAEFLGFASAFIGAVLYMFAPYRFVDLYVRGDIGENLAFAFMPLALYFILKLSHNVKSKYLTGGFASVALLILSHNAIALMYMPFIFLYGLVLGFYLKNKKEYFVNFLFLLALGLGLSAFFWIPGLLEAKFTLRNIVTKGSYISRFVDIKSLLYGSWSYGGTGQFTVQLGILQWISIVLSPFLVLVLWRKKRKESLLLLSLLIYTLAAIFLMLAPSNFIWQRFIILQNFQFPWRFLSITVFSASVLGALVFNKISLKAQKFAVLVFVIVIFFLSKDYLRAQGYLQKSEDFFTGVYNSTTDTGESSPIWSVRFMEKRAAGHMEVLDGSAKIEVLKYSSTYHKYHIIVDRRTLFQENTLYFPGWEIKANGKLLGLEFQNQQHKGVMLFFLDKGDYIVEAFYKETKLRLLSDFISVASLIAILVYNVWSIKLWRRFQ